MTTSASNGTTQSVCPMKSFGTHGRVTTDFNGGPTTRTPSRSMRTRTSLSPATRRMRPGRATTSPSPATPAPAFPIRPFNGTGPLTTDILGEGDLATSIALQPDGRILVGGRVSDSPSAEHFGIVRYESDGQLDDSFGDHGVALGAIAGSADGLVVQPDGKILIAVGEVGDFAVARFDEFRRCPTPDLRRASGS